MANAWLAHARGTLALLIFFSLLGTTAVAQSKDDLAALNARVNKFYSQGKYEEATGVAKQSLALAEKKFGPNHPEVGDSLNNLAELYRVQGRFSEAEPLYKRTIAMAEEAQGPDHLDVGIRLNNLAALYQDQGRLPEAEALIERALAIAEKALGFGHPTVGTFLNNLASMYVVQGRYSEAEPLFKRTAAIFEKAHGPDHSDVGTSLNNLAEVYQYQGRSTEAEPLYKRGLAISEKALGPNHPEVGGSLNNLAELYRAQGRYAEAEPLYKRSLAIMEKALGSEAPSIGISLGNLAQLFKDQGRYAEAEPLYKRCVAILEKALSADHPDVGTSLNNLATLYEDQGRIAEAEPLYKRSLAIREKALGADHPVVGGSLNNLAGLYQGQGRLTEAELLHKRSIALWEKALGAEHPLVGTSLNNLAELYRAQDRFADAEALYMRSLSIREKALGADHPDFGGSLNNIALLYYRQQDWSRAADYWRRSANIVVRRTQRGTAIPSAQLQGDGKNKINRTEFRFFRLVKALNRLPGAQAIATDAVKAESFVIAQWALSSDAAASLAQMAVRGATGNLGLAMIVRERQDLLGEWLRRDGARTAAVSQPSAKRDRSAEAANVARLTEVDTRIGTIDKRLVAEFPDYAAISSPQPLTVEQLQADLRSDEAMVLFLDTPNVNPLPEETFVWVITKTEARWVRSELGTPTLTREVTALRCGIDSTAWRGSDCGELTGKSYTDSDRKAGKPLPFDHRRSHKLYQALFGQVEDLIKGKQLLLVPSGPLTQLPFQVLVTAPPAGDDPKTIRWLARDHAITVLPAVSSLKALRRIGKPSAATEAMIGFGNPLLDGKQEHPQFGDYYKKQAALARANQSCPDKPWQRVAALFGARREVEPFTTRGGLADLAHLRSQAPLPETARELCEVASSLNVDRKNIWLGARATETNIKRLSAATDGTRLANYRIVHFATHGTLAGQLSGTTEPGLLLTPPDKATEEDDGYLSAGEIAGLKLDADWVILSACNTAAGNAKGAEALGGLARAFFYAGARALLVSHWEVDSEATVKLITSAVGAMAKDKSVGRAEALRRAMLNMIDSGQPHESHPAYWAPFVVVGEGAAAR